MLDERNELLEYIRELSTTNEARPLSSIYKKDKYGLKRALGIIARHILFDELDYYNLCDNEKRLQAVAITKDILNSWCGFSTANGQADRKTDVPSQWMNNYYRIFLPNRSYNELEKNHSLYNRPIYSNLGAGVSLMNAINFSQIIADAVCEGPLKKYYLLCNENYYESLYKDTTPLKLSKNGSFQTKDRHEVDKFLKIVAFYLLQKRLLPNCSQVPFHTADLANWMAWSNLATKSTERPKINNWRPAGAIDYAPVYTLSKSKLGPGLAIEISEEYLNYYHFRIAEYDNTKKAPEHAPGEIFFKDKGCAVDSLINGQNKIYPLNSSTSGMSSAVIN